MWNGELSGQFVTLEEFLPIRRQLQKDNLKLIWTNGCFDILHEGHAIYLQNARKLGDRLLVALNSDRSFSRWKNKPGPIHTEAQRASVLLSLRSVDFVIIFDDSSPIELLKKVRPDVYVKGADYTLATIDQNERAVVESYGGEILFCPGSPGLSTTNIIAKILTLYPR